MTNSFSRAPILNVSGYKFVALKDLPGLRVQFKEKALVHELKGTILISLEGINAFLAGKKNALDAFRAWLSEDERFQGIPWKDSYSETQPFKRMLVRIKKEIISMGAPLMCEHVERAPAVSPKDLKTWLEQEDEVVLLDTRNDYEVKLGRFNEALDLNLHHFRDFPERVKKLLAEYRHKKVVTYCTGGIRCEKAALYMSQLGFEQVYQLDGGILKYFEECHGEHYQGDCFVFDKRVALDKDLQPTDAVMCFACLNPLTAEEQRSPLYVLGEQCPYCAARVASKKEAHTYLT